MKTSLEPERDDLDEWIGKVLKAGFEDVQLPEQVWRRIAHELVNSGGTEELVVLGGQPFDRLRTARIGFAETD